MSYPFRGFRTKMNRRRLLKLASLAGVVPGLWFSAKSTIAAQDDLTQPPRSAEEEVVESEPGESEIRLEERRCGGRRRSGIRPSTERSRRRARWMVRPRSTCRAGWWLRKRPSEPGSSRSPNRSAARHRYNMAPTRARAPAPDDPGGKDGPPSTPRSRCPRRRIPRRRGRRFRRTGRACPQPQGRRRVAP